ncbi:unnamed protein product [Acanthosepion pharaonis]|uniref:Uncharacterized protein n=1 Tax=Acanthosepion pharaonis TaxID=158019 RepID=A0A812CHT0_ACAPH|nr:unnamed protein product [Sepia pharaonis]
MNEQAAPTASASRASETHHQRLLRNLRKSAATSEIKGNSDTFRRRARESSDAAATANTRAAETPLGSAVRNARNTVTTARSKAAETFERRRAHQSSEAAAAARSRESETELQRATRNASNAAATSATRNFKGPQISKATTNMVAVRYTQTPQARCIRLDGDIHRLAGASGVTCPRSSFWPFLAFNYDPSINLTMCDINVESMTCVSISATPAKGPVRMSVCAVPLAKFDCHITMNNLLR